MTDGLWYSSAADAARAANISHSTLLYKLNKGKIDKAYLDEDSGQWRIPLQSLLNLGYTPTGEGTVRIGTLDQDNRHRSLLLSTKLAAALGENVQLTEETRSRDVTIGLLRDDLARLRRLLADYGIEDPTRKP